MNRSELSKEPRVARTLGARIVAYTCLVLLAVPFIFPALWMLSSSLKPDAEIFAYPPSLLPKQWEWSNYVEIFQVQPFARQYFNSFYITVLVTLGTVVCSTLAGYAFARLRFRGATALFLLIVSGQLIPEEVTIIPLYRLVSDLGLVNSHLPLILMPIFSGTGVVAMFVMRQAFLSLPRELEEAARIDGLSWFGTYWRIAMPLVRPSVSVVVVLGALNSWNMFLEPLIFLRDHELFTVPLALTQFEDGYSGPMWNLKMAASSVTLITILVVFMVAQRHIISGLTRGALKS